MDDDQWRSAYDVVQRAECLPPSERLDFVKTQISDPDLLELVVELLGDEEGGSPNAGVTPATRIGRYEIRGKLGRGGMGRVYSAYDHELGRIVAMKFVAPELIALRRSTKQLVKEAQAASALNHPHIITVHELIRSGDEVAIVMELVEGESLRAYCREPQQPEKVSQWGVQIAEALSVAHQNNIVHSDIKPENVMVRADGYVKVLDFGLARQLFMGESSDSVRVGAGTVQYYSPEQVTGQRPRSASDIFSLGMVFYELLAGRHPFSGETPFDIAHAIVNEKPGPPSAHNPNVPQRLDRLILRMLEKSAATRPTASEVVRELAYPAEPKRISRRWLIAGGAAAACAAAGGVWLERHRRIDSLAVLPFENADASAEFLSQGVGHEITAGLSQLPGVRVIGYSGSAHFRDRAQDTRAIGKQLDVASLLCGRMEKNGSSVTLTVELVNARTGESLWSGQFEKPLLSIMTFEEDISSQIAAKLALRFVDRRKSGTNAPAAYELYLRARYYFNRRSQQDMALATEYCQQALALDKRFAQAWALLAASYGFTPGMYNSLTPDELYKKTQFAAQKALEIQPDLPDVHVTLGGIKFFQRRDWAGAEHDFLRAIEINPNEAQAHYFLGILMRVLGRKEAERYHIRKARALDPLSPIIADHVAWTEYFRGDDVAALSEIEKAVALDPVLSSNYTLIGYVRLRQKRHKEAIAAFLKARETASGLGSLGDLGYAYAISGDPASAHRVLDQLESRRETFTPSGPLAWIQMGLGDKDKAFVLFDKAADERFQWLNYINIWSVFEGLEADPRFALLKLKLKL